MNNESSLPKVSIVTVSYNQREFVRQTIESVLQQSYPNIEYIVIDGGSTDGSVELISEYRDRLAYFVSEKDDGQSDALNKGFARATGDILCWINSDDYFQPEGIARLVEIFPPAPGPQWLIAGCELVDATGQRIAIRDGSHADLTRTFIWGSKNWFPQQATFWNRAMWQHAGPLDVDLHYTMDYALWLRMYQAATPAVSKDVLSAYRFHDQAKGKAGRIATLRELMEVRGQYFYRHFSSSLSSKVLDEAWGMDIRNLATALGD